jgi:hypothetical protein
MDLSMQLAEAEILLYEYTKIEQRWDEARLTLNAHILGLLEHDLPALYQLLYKVDIDERKARQAFGGDSKTIAFNLTELIMQRILQKAESRLKYRPK